MRLKEAPLKRKNLKFIKENMRQAKQYLDSGKISKQDLDALIKIDPTPQKKYVGWMAKVWIKEHPNINELNSIISEFDTLTERGRTSTKDIGRYKTFEDLKKEVDILNQTGDNLSNRELENNYDTIIDNSDLLVISPNTHEASRKVGLAHYAFRDSIYGGKDSAWCTTYNTPKHFNSYYFQQKLTFFYVRVKSQRLINQLKKAFPSTWQNLIGTAITVDMEGSKNGFDNKDNPLPSSELSKYLQIIGLS